MEHNLATSEDHSVATSEDHNGRVGARGGVGNIPGTRTVVRRPRCVIQGLGVSLILSHYMSLYLKLPFGDGANLNCFSCEGGGGLVQNSETNETAPFLRASGQLVRNCAKPMRCRKCLPMLSP